MARSLLYDATRSATKFVISSGVTVAFSTTNALGTSPHSSSAIGMTAASAIDGGTAKATLDKMVRSSREEAVA